MPFFTENLRLMMFSKIVVFLSLSLLSSSVIIAQNENSGPRGSLPSETTISNKNTSPDSTNRTLFRDYFSRCSARYGIKCPQKDLSIPAVIELAINGEAMGPFYFPFRGKLLSPYGPRHRRMHAGLDIKLQKGDTVKSAFNGVVRLSKRFHGYGLMVVVSHPNGLETLYGHLSKILVEDGQVVVSGEPVGLGGRTGRATTNHLHFETRVFGQHFNPLKFIDFDTYSITKEKLLVYNRDGKFQILAEGEPFEEPLLAEEDMPMIDSMAVADSSVAPRDTVVKPKVKHIVKAKYHRVKKGDTLYSIARKNKIPLDDLYKMNKLKPGAVLSIGKRLRLN
jgi:murein DD-endopeptidase MepM/ murein hydrolase activator NlpD